MHTPLLVGRDRELATLDELLSGARAGRGGVVVLASGEAGAGKTALADAVAARARQSGGRVAWGACREGDGGAPYAPWLTVLRALGQSASALGDLATDGEPAGRFRLFEDVITVVRDAAAPSGLLVVLDDLHWADIGSLVLLQSLADRIDGAPVVVLGLHRDEMVGSGQVVLLRAIGRERVTRTMVLTGLSAPDAAGLAEATVGHPLPETVLDAIVDRSAGNPLFIGELARLADAPGTGATLPSSIRGVIGQRVAQLPEPAVEMLRHASIVGRDFTAPLIAAVSERDLVEVLDAVDTAASAGLVTVEGHTVRFAHILTQEVLYTEMSTAERQRLHARVADALSASGALDALAHHLREAAPLLGPEPALRATLQAARQADRQLAYEHAVDHYRAALGLIGEASPARRAAVLLELARCEVRSGAVDAAWRTCQKAAGIGRATASPELVADAATVLRGVPSSATRPQIHALCREALSGLPTTDTVRTARVLAQLAITADPFGEIEPDLSRRALAAAEASGDPYALSLALHARHTELRNVEYVLERLNLGERAVQLGRDANDEDTVCWAHWWRLSAFIELGRRGPLSTEMAAFTAAVEHLREPMWLWRLEMLRSAQAAFEGRFTLARTLIDRAYAIGRRGGNDDADFLALVMRSHVAVRTGEGLPEIEAGVRQFVEQGPFLARGWLAFVLLAMGRTEETAALWSSFAPQLDSFPRHASEWMASGAGSTTVCVAMGDRDTASILYEQLRPYADRWLNGEAYNPNEGPVSLYLGMLATLREDWAAALAHLDSALAACRAMGSEPYEAITRFSLGRLLLAWGGPGHVQAGTEHLDAAMSAARRLGMAPLSAAAAALGRSSRPALSSREEQVAALVADGLSNRQIATRLRLSERTAENHVAHILTKLGFQSRARIAAWYATRPTD
jgi:DNA-binding CsgD family transcriptional regulator/tetratricopeptide (TPR) repeat protein